METHNKKLLRLAVLLMVLFTGLWSCSKVEEEPHYTVCISCIYKNTGDTAADYCTTNDLADIALKNRLNATFVISGERIYSTCWKKNVK
jgi:hypothetical protein